ncbi:MAG TPA: SDR family NAD(P)-dependent oxidoreductase [Acidimicrobiia bacterium]
MQDFTGKTAVITGAASGIGRGLAVAFAREGARIVAVDLDRDGLDATAAFVRDAGVEVLTDVIDVRDSDGLVALAATVDDRFGGADVLCNNAGVFRGGVVWQSPIEDWEWVFSINLYGVINGLRAFVPRMIAHGREAHIVNTASMAGLVATGMSGVYTVSKFAVEALSEVLANDLHNAGASIGVSVLCPSAVATQIAASQRNREVTPGPAEDADAIEQILSDFCGRGIDPMDVGPMVVEAVRRGQFVIGTRDTLPEFVRVRAEALQRYELPPFQMFD